MAKAKQIPGLEASMSYAEAAGRTVAIRGEEIFEHGEGVLDMVDIERVHAMRVATRRLRAVLEIYAPCFPHEELRPVLRDVKQLADALGARRDPDVELLALEQFAVSVGPDERAGVEHFIARTRAEQEEGNRRLEAALDEVEQSALRGRIARLATLAARPDQIGAGHDAHKAHGDGPETRHARRADDVPAQAETPRRDAAPAQAETPRRDAPPARREGRRRQRQDEAQSELLADRIYGLDGEPA